MSIQVSSKCLLHYSFQEAPNGLRVSLDQTHTQGEAIELAISNTSGSTVYVKKITISFPLGADQANHFAAGNNLTFNAIPSDQYTIMQQSPGVFVITPVNGSQYITWLNQGLYLRFTGIIMNTSPGVAKIKIDEQSGHSSNSGFQDEIGWYWFGKYPYEFHMRNFVADNSTIAPNTSVTLTWTGAANGNYKLKWYDANGMQSADVTATRSWQSPPLTQSTVFELYGTSTSGPQRAISLAATVFVKTPAASTAVTNFLAGSSLSITGGQVELNCTGATSSAFSNKTGTLVQISTTTGTTYEHFHSANTGTVAWVDVFFVSSSGSTGITLTDESNSHGIVPLASTTIVAAPNSWNRIVFSKAVSLKKGTKYSVQFFKADNNSTYVLGGSYHHIDQAYCAGQPSNVNVWMDVAMTPLVPSGLVVTPEGKVGVGTMMPNYLLEVNGTIHATKVQESSDISLKRNIATLPDALAQLLQLRGVQYERRDSGQQEIGLISQEVEQVFPDLVHQDAQGLGSVAYTRLTAVLVEAIKTLNAQMEALRAEITEMRSPHQDREDL